MGTQLVRKVYNTDCSWTAPAGVTNITVRAVPPFAKQIVAGCVTNAAITSDGNSYSWGSNTVGQLGIGSQTAACQPTLICCGLKWKSISMNPVGVHAVGLTTDGTGYAWGANGSGRLGICTGVVQVCVPTPICCGFKWKTLVAGGSISSGITKDGDMYSWGSGTAGRLGNGTTVSVCVPSLVCCGLKWMLIAQYSSGTVGVTTSGDAYAWGEGSNGALGNNSTSDRCVPTPVCCGLKFKFISGGGANQGFVLGITCSGDLYAWGDNSSGKLGDGTVTQRNMPVPICSGTKWKYVSAGATHSLGITCSGDAYAWGNFSCGVGGTGIITCTCVPTLVCCGIKWVAIEAGISSSFGISIHGEAFAWGSNLCGSIGNGSITSQCLPTPVCCSRNAYIRMEPETSKAFSVIPGQSYCVSVMNTFSSFNFDPVGVLSEALVLEYYQSNSA